ncbi:MAG: hypothetical protein A3F68_12195 [Acidobacteria bacterium RIFCSPLOWO2_12_FULL_54_10]|nr:MAG: hypothetical protein A3F68_12195 [Acidobacteria bacterium RIFCSPLOWO2_12_FULL_54_10]
MLGQEHVGVQGGSLADYLANAVTGCLAQDDARLVAAMRSGSDDAFDQLIDAYSAPLYRFAHRLLHDPAQASDTVQEVFLSVFRSIGQFQGNCSLKSWLYRITVHAVANQNRWWRRHTEREKPLEDSAADLSLQEILADRSAPDPFTSLLAHETQELVHRALRNLPESFGVILVLRELEELSYEEIAGVLHISLGTVRSRLARGRLALKTELESLLAPAAGGVPAWTPAD